MVALSSRPERIEYHASGRGNGPHDGRAHRQVEAVKALLSRGADRSGQREPARADSLMWAAAEGNVEAVEALIAAARIFMARVAPGLRRCCLPYAKAESALSGSVQGRRERERDIENRRVCRRKLASGAGAPGPVPARWSWRLQRAL